MSSRSRLEQRSVAFVHEYVGDVLFVTSLALVLVVITGLSFAVWWAGAGRQAALDVADLVSKVSTTAVLLVGSVVAYHRFIKARVSAEQVEVAVLPTVVARLPGSAEASGPFLHAVEVSIKNIGTATLFGMETVVRFRSEPDGESVDLAHRVTTIPPREVPAGSAAAVAPGETVHQHWTYVVPANIAAVTVDVIVKTQSQNLWQRAATIANEKTAKS